MHSTIEIHGVPIDLGANIRGANMGPAAIRIADLHAQLKALGYKVLDRGDLAVPVRDTLDVKACEQKFLSQIVEVTQHLATATQHALSANHIPLMLGGDHCLAIGSVAGLNHYYSGQRQKFGLLWVDAHADLNTPTTTVTGNIHGMPLSTCLGWGHPALVQVGAFDQSTTTCLAAENIALVGIRMLDGAEKAVLTRSGIRYFTMREIDERGMHAVARDALAIVGRGTSGVHLSFDMDAMDPLYAPGVSTPVTGGISCREAHLLLEILADSRLLRSMDFVELNPMQDIEHKTARLVVELVLSALGKAII